MSRTKPSENYRKVSPLLASKINIKPVNLHLPPAHPKQFELITALDTHPGLRFVVGACGTKFGKTYGSSIALTQRAWNVKGSLNWWVAPTFAQSKMAYTLVKRLLPEGTFNEAKADLRLTLLQPDGSERSVIEFKSGDNPDSLRGFGVKFFIMDEAARCPYESYVSLLTTVTQTRGCGFFISTPHARNWFYDAYQKGEKNDTDGNPLYGGKSGQVDPNPEWLSIRMPTWSNPWVELDSIREMRRNLPEDVFRQEVGAQFLMDSAGVFRGIKGCIRGEFEEPAPGQWYYLGVDLARIKDYSVLTVMNKDRHVVAFERFNQIPWEVQYERMIRMAKKYRATVCIDSTGIGDPIVETIQNAGIVVSPYKISGTTAKQQLIDKLRINIENQRVSFPPIPILRKELESYEYEISPSGNVKFSAPSGQHDDCVISLALANFAADVDPFVYKYYSARGV